MNFRPTGSEFLTERRAIEALGTSLTGSDRALVVAFPTMALSPGHLATEDDAPDPSSAGRTRDVTAAKAFFHKALKRHGEPRVITLDGFEPTHAALRRMGMNNEFNYPSRRTVTKFSFFQLFKVMGKGRIWDSQLISDLADDQADRMG